MYYIGLYIHKKTISYCVKDAAGCVHREGKIGSSRRELDAWVRTLPQPRMMAMEATIFTGWIYDYLLPHAEKLKVAHPLMLRAIAAAKKKNDKIDAAKPLRDSGYRCSPFVQICRHDSGHCCRFHSRDGRCTLRRLCPVVPSQNSHSDPLAQTTREGAGRASALSVLTLR